MDVKNLPLKFASLAVIVAAFLWLVLYMEPNLGIDLRGGHSLIYEIRSLESERKELKDRLAVLKGQISAAGSAEAKSELEAELDRVEAELEHLERVEGSSQDLVQRVISVLKARVDPLGLKFFEWRPLVGYRFEVRMPAASPESRAARRRYFDDLLKLSRGNISPADLNRFLPVSPDEREARIAELAGEDSRQAKLLRELGQAHDEVVHAEQKLQEVRKALEEAVSAGRSREELERLRDARAEAEKELREKEYPRYEKRLEVLDGNISPTRVRDILANYVSKREAKAIRIKKDVDRRTARFKTELERLRKKFPARVADIDAVVASHKAWAEVRQPLDDPEDLKRLISKTGVLEFRIAPYVPEIRDATKADSRAYISEVDRNDALESLQEEGPDGLRRRNAKYVWFPIRGDRTTYSGLVVADYAGKSYMLVHNTRTDTMLHEPGVAGWKLTDAFPGSDRFGRPAVDFVFDGRGARRFAAMTSGHIGQCMAILLDDEVYSAPTIQSTISERGQITGQFTREDVIELVRTLNAGSLPARLNPKPVQESTFGSSFGKQDQMRGIRAGFIGLIVVAVFMLVYYLMAGCIANVALLLNLIMVLGAMNLLNATYTLPGIAGLILTIGIAVDANVLIFERLREEQAKGQSVRMAIKNAYDRAFRAIFDANITTLITCLILGWVGTEEVRGFAITLGLGVAFSLYTSLYVTRWVFQALVQAGRLKKPVFMLRLLGVPKINWMGKRHFFWGVSILLIVMGVASVVRQGGDIWGIEFSSGTQATLQLKPDALVTNPDTNEPELPTPDLVSDAFLREARRLAEAGAAEYEKLIATAQIEPRIDPDAPSRLFELCDTDRDGRITAAEWKAQGLNEDYFRKLLARLDEAGDGVLARDEVTEENLPTAAFRVSTTETDVDRIKTVARRAFGTLLARRLSRDYELVGMARSVLLDGAVEAGASDESRELWRQARTAYRGELRIARDAALIAIDRVTPAMTEGELAGAIEDMRQQQDFADELFHETRVTGLTPAGEDGYSSFALLVTPMDEPEDWDEFAVTQVDVIDKALRKSDPVVARNIGPAIAGETAQLAIVALVLSWLAIVAYLWLRFGSAQWGLAAVICLIHDVIIVVGLVAASGWLHNTFIGPALGIESFKIDLVMVAAFLTVIGYSVNDTIVVFDRIRENRGKLATISPQVINNSINQTLSRTVLTSGTTFIVVITMYAWGGPGIHAFNYALLAGILFGTYSSVAIASPLLMGFRKALVAKVAGPAADGA